MPDLGKFVPRSIECKEGLRHIHASEVCDVHIGTWNDIDTVAIRRMAAEIAIAAIEVRETDADAVAVASGDVRSAERKKDKLIAQRQLLGDDGPAVDANASAEIIREHWQPVFAAKTTDGDAMRQFENVIQTAKHKQWHLDVDLVATIIRATNMSAADPDGIPYSAYRAVVDLAAPAFVELFRTIVECGCVRDDFNDSLLMFLPKDSADGIATSAKKPDDSRPLCLSNTDAKLVASMLNSTLSAIAAESVHLAQAGFIKHRSMTDNVLSIEAAALSCAATAHAASRPPDRDPRPWAEALDKALICSARQQAVERVELAAVDRRPVLCYHRLEIPP